VEPSLESTQAEAQAAIMNGNSTSNSTGANSGVTLPSGHQPWTNVSLLDASGSNSYPIASFSYLLLYKELSTNINSMEKASRVCELGYY